METFKNLCKLQLKKKRKEKKSSISKPIEKKKKRVNPFIRGVEFQKKWKINFENFFRYIFII
jgi:hypothetical protein